MSEVSKAAEILRDGGLVAFPTETVYGLGCDATNAEAVQRVFQVKGRPGTNPLIVHVADQSVAQRYAAEWPATATKLAERFWPGPLTLVVRKRPEIVPAVTGGLETVGLRSPDHPLTLALLREFDGPVAGPSANRSTRVSPTSARHVQDEFGRAVDLILDGGACRVGIESTVLDLTSEVPTIYRPGGISAEQLEAVIGPVKFYHGAATKKGTALSPGQQTVHYAPRATAYRFEPRRMGEVIAWCLANPGRAWAILAMDVLALDPAAAELLPIVSAGGRGPVHKLVQMPTDAKEYARRLYATFRMLDEEGVEVMWVETPPDDRQWVAVRDRLNRATRPMEG
ncbi:MAG TPA: L-threonylcarbamoyladenylate synthase [Tepidisphaeraceae bacterium]|nr:L-threonylcarbamoyladenylate synthase [Tepidisphaeraceae bacterium]